MFYADVPLYEGVRADPLTHRAVSARCWNGYHQERGLTQDYRCRAAQCQCYCHPEKDPGPGKPMPKKLQKEAA